MGGFLIRLSRAIAYARQGWKSEDDHYEHLLDDIEFKLWRMHRHLERLPQYERNEIHEITADAYHATLFWAERMKVMKTGAWVEREEAINKFLDNLRKYIFEFIIW